MKLYYSSVSPYARKVRIVALEKDILLELIAVTPAENPPILHEANPIGKIPTLVVNKRNTLAESHHICTYLEKIKRTPAVFPKSRRALLQVLHRDALSIGMMDATVRYIIEMRRPKEIQSPAWLERQLNAIKRALPVFEKEIDMCLPDFAIDQISLVSCLGYLDLRLPELSWKNQYHKLAAWYQHICERKSVQETMPA